MLTISVVIVAALMLFVGGWLVGRLGIGSVVDPASLIRVFFYGDRYAGTRPHGDTGGPMSGRIEERQSGATG